MAEHVALLGDSIFDNGSYTQGEPDVVQHLREILPNGWTASLLALDGSTTEDLESQLAGLEPSVTRVVVSIGGNDALLNIDLLDLPVASTRYALKLFGQRATLFEGMYRSAIRRVLERHPRVAVCTIYNGNLDESEAGPARVALMLFNDAILRVAFELGLDVIDLRLVCTERDDYANAIEPSGKGGRKVARAIARALGALEEGGSRSRVYAG